MRPLRWGPRAILYKMTGLAARSILYYFVVQFDDILSRLLAVLWGVLVDSMLSRAWIYCTYSVLSLCGFDLIWCGKLYLQLAICSAYTVPEGNAQIFQTSTASSLVWVLQKGLSKFRIFGRWQDYDLMLDYCIDGFSGAVLGRLPRSYKWV